MNMPGQLATRSHRNHLAVSAENRNEKTVDEILRGENESPVFFGRIEANLGSYFRIILHDGITSRTAQASPRGLFKQRKAQIRFFIGDIVALEGNMDAKMTEAERAARKGNVYEIVAKFSKKEANYLFKNKRLHESVYKQNKNEDDELFDYEGQENEEQEDMMDSDEEHELFRGGRGSGGKKKQAGGGVGQAGRAKQVVKEMVDAEEYKNTIHADDPDADERETAADMEKFSSGPDWGDAPVPGSAAALAAAAAKAGAAGAVDAGGADGEGEGEGDKEKDDDMWGNNTKLPVYTSWEDAMKEDGDGELDIDAI